MISVLAMEMDHDNRAAHPQRRSAFSVKIFGNYYSVERCLLVVHMILCWLFCFCSYFGVVFFFRVEILVGTTTASDTMWLAMDFEPPCLHFSRNALACYASSC